LERNAELYDLALHPTNDQIVLAGTQDNHAIRYDGQTNRQWTQLRHTHGDSLLVAFDHRDAKYAYAVGQNMAEVQRSTDGGSDFPQAISRSLGSCFINGEFLTRRANDIFPDPASPGVLMVTCDALWSGPHSVPGQQFCWQQEFAAPAPGRVTSWAYDTSLHIQYASVSNGQVWTRRSPQPWQLVYQHPHNSGVVALSIDPFEPTRVYTIFEGEGPGCVFLLQRSSSEPSAELIGRDISGEDTSEVNVPQPFPPHRRPNNLAVDLINRHVIYVGTDHGIYCGRTLDTDRTWLWEPFNDGFPAADTRALEVHRRTGILYAATFGRGAYRVATAPPLGSLVADEGVITSLRVLEPGTAYGPPEDRIDADVVFHLDSRPGRAFGFVLREGGSALVGYGMLKLLQDCFSAQQRVRVEYVRRSLQNNLIMRVLKVT
jgi:hypothetical protein